MLDDDHRPSASVRAFTRKGSMVRLPSRYPRISTSAPGTGRPSSSMNCPPTVIAPPASVRRIGPAAGIGRGPLSA